MQIKAGDAGAQQNKAQWVEITLLFSFLLLLLLLLFFFKVNTIRARVLTFSAYKQKSGVNFNGRNFSFSLFLY